MKRNVICVCLALLILEFAMPYSIHNLSKSVQVTRGDKMKHSPVNVHSISKKTIKIM